MKPVHILAATLAMVFLVIYSIDVGRKNNLMEAEIRVACLSEVIEAFGPISSRHTDRVVELAQTCEAYALEK